MALVITTWLWGSKFGPKDVYKLANGLSRNLKQEYNFICVHEHDQTQMDLIPASMDVPRMAPEDVHLTKIKGCFARLRTFDPAWQKYLGAEPGDRIVTIDLDTVITGPLDPLFDRDEDFVIMQGGNESNPNPYNGALQMLRAGAYSEVWSDFDLATEMSWVRGSKSPIDRPYYYEFPDDQGHIAHKIPGADGWKTGPEHGVYVYQKPGWPGGKTETKLPNGARLVTFINKTPEYIVGLPWAAEHWW